MNHTITVTGKDEPELQNLIAGLSAELNFLKPDSPRYHVTEATIEDAKSQLLHARVRHHAAPGRSR